MTINIKFFQKLLVVVLIVFLFITYINFKTEEKTIKAIKGSIEILGLGEHSRQIINCYIVDNTEYIYITDFVNLCNEMNNNLKLIRNINSEDYNPQEHTLKVTYRRDGHFTNSFTSNLISDNFILKSSKVVGNDFTMFADFGNTQFKYERIEGKDYLPFEAIRNLVFNDNLYLLNVGDSKYEFHKDSITDLIVKNNFSIHLQPNNELLNRSFHQLLSIENLDLTDRTFSDYTEYYFELLKIIDLRNDYHSNVYPITDLSSVSLKALGYDEFLLTSNIMKFYNLSSKSTSNNVMWESLNKNTLYLKCNGFSMNFYEFMSKMNKLNVYLSENKDIQEVIIDLRNNAGGYTSNALQLFRIFAGKNIEFSIGNKHENELYSKQIYTIENIKKSYKDYQITVILNEASMSASIVLSVLLNENCNTNIVGVEPLYKQTSEVCYFQLFDGTVISQSSQRWSLLTANEQEYSHVQLVDKTMSESEIKFFLESFKKEY